MKQIDKKSHPKETMEKVQVMGTTLSDILVAARTNPKRGPVDNDPPMRVYDQYD